MQPRSPHLRLLLLQVLLLLVPAAVAGVPDRYTAPRGRFSAGAGNNNASAQEYLDPTFPLPRPPQAAPSCIVPVLSDSFADTYGAPPVKAAYEPPADCPAPWSLVVLSFSAAVSGEQHNRVAAVWIDGVELLRTTTAKPTPDGVRWTVRKDVTRYSSLLRSPPNGVLSVMLENMVNDEYTGVYNVTISFEFHGTPAYLSDMGSASSSIGPGATATAPDTAPATPTLPKSYFELADLILPVSETTSESGGFWFHIQNSSHSGSKLVSIPSNTYRAILEVFVSPHSYDESWYSNPPDLYINENNLATRRGNAAYREVVASVDRHFTGSFVPFPVIYAGGINPLLWQPVAALGAFNLPSYDIELTPFLGLLVDGKAHEIALSVVDGIAEWLVDANLHLWLDPNSSDVSAALGRYSTPRLSIKRRYTTRLLDGSFDIHAKRKSSFSGWVKSSFGNFTTEVETELEATSLVQFTDQGKNRTVRLQVEQETEIVIRSEAEREVGKVETESKYPLLLETVTEDGENGTSVTRANLTHSLSIEKEAEAQGLFEREWRLVDEQTAAGWLLVGDDHDVLNGSATTSSAYRYRDDAGRYERAIDAREGAVLSDNVTESYRAVGVGAAQGCCSGRRCPGTATAKCSDIAAM